MNKYLKTVIYIVFAIIATMNHSCKKHDNNPIDSLINKEDLIGTWVASAGKYNLSMEITETTYHFALTESGNGGTNDDGTYSISDANISFVSKGDVPFAIGGLQDKKLALTFVNSIIIGMIGTGAASNTAFTKYDGTGDYKVSGSLEYSKTASWSTVSASFDGGTSYAASTTIINSSFNLVLSAPKATFFKPVSASISQTGITINPQDAKIVEVSFFAIKGDTKAELTQVGLNGSSISSLIAYLYADKDVSVSGTHTYSNGSKDVYNLKLKKGWNTVINTWNYSTTEDDFYNTGSIPSNSTWITESDVSSAPAMASAKQASAGYKE
jgi:hypothetical protein